MKGDRWMLFVDGENIAQRGAAAAVSHGVELVGPTAECTSEWYIYSKKDLFWPHQDPRVHRSPLSRGLELERLGRAAFYYTSVTQEVTPIREQLATLGWKPRVFRRTGKRARKRVDIMLTTEALSHAFYDNYDVAFVATHDEDFVPLFEEIQRAGKLVVLGHFGESVAAALLEHADYHFDLSSRYWFNFPAAAKLQAAGLTDSLNSD